MDFTPATLARYAVAQQRKHREELGFLPRLAITEYADRGQIIPALENGELAAYVLFYDGRNGNRPVRHPNTLHIHQICTQYDARRLQNATHLINRLLDRAIENRFTEITAWVATDIPANQFWRDVGFTHIASRLGGEKRNRIHNLWRMEVPLDGHRSTVCESIPHRGKGLDHRA